MDHSTAKNDILDTTIDDKEVYCRDVTPIFIKLANNHFTFVKVTEELNFECFTREHEEIDNRIAAILKKIKTTLKESEELDREIYNKSQIKNQVRIRIKTTGEIITVLKDEAEKLQNNAKKIGTKCLELTKAIKDLHEKKNNNENSKKKIDEREREIKSHLDVPDPCLEKNIIKKHQEFKELLHQKKESFKMKRIKKDKIAEMKEQKINLLIKINKKQEENRIIKQEIEKKNDIMKRFNKEMEQKWHEVEENINNEITNRDVLMQNLTQSIKNCEVKQLKVKDLGRIITEKETKLEDLKRKYQEHQECINKENKKKQKDYENERNKLLNIEKNLQDALDEHVQHLNILAEKTQNLNNLQVRKEQLTVQFCDQKIKVLTGQYENKDYQNKVDILSQKLYSEKQQVEQLKHKNQELDEKQEKVEKNKEDYPKEFEEKRKQIELNHKEKIEALLKQQNFYKATMEFVQNRLDKYLNEIENLKKGVKDLEESNKWGEMKYGLQKTTLNSIQERGKKEQLAYEKLLAETKQKETQYEMVEAEKTVTIKEHESFIENSSGILKNKSPLKAPEPMMEVNENKGEDIVLSGRKSPGILKTAFKEPKQPQTPTKRVTFEGLSSTESSSISNESQKALVKNVEEETLDEFLKDWGNTSFGSSKRSKGVPMDF